MREEAGREAIKQTCRHTYIQAERQAVIHTASIQAVSNTGKQAVIQTTIHICRQADKQAGRQAGR